ncbi:MAG: hypothetical protein AAFO04_01120 [Cyanobacteria bacterium J06592_8]
MINLKKPRLKLRGIRSGTLGLLILISLLLTAVYTHWEFSILTGLLIAIISKGMRRSRPNLKN